MGAALGGGGCLPPQKMEGISVMAFGLPPQGYWWTSSDPTVEFSGGALGSTGLPLLKQHWQKTSSLNELSHPGCFPRQEVLFSA